MAEKVTLQLQPRTVVGKAVKSLRKQGIVPGNVVVPGEDSVIMGVSLTQFNKLYAKVGETGLVYLEIAGESKPRPALIESVETHSLTGVVQHVVFRQVNLKVKTRAEIPVEVVGESAVPGAVLIRVVDSIEVEALPADLPEHFEVSVADLKEIGQTITFKDLVFDRSKVTLLISDEELETPIVTLQEVREEVEEAPVVSDEPADSSAAAASAEAVEKSA